MRLVASVLVALLPVLVACGTEEGTATEGRLDQPAPASAPPVPEAIPAAAGQVRSRHLVTVLDQRRPVLCLGPVEGTMPPSCDGTQLRGWRWRDHPLHERAGDVRWGSFAVTGTWDGTAFTVTEAVPAALYDVPADESPARPTPDTVRDPELLEVVDQTGALPGHLTSYVSDAEVLVELVHDDGSLQEWAEQMWEPTAVVLLPQLVPGDPS